jgi:hypothetical protein
MDVLYIHTVVLASTRRHCFGDAPLYRNFSASCGDFSALWLCRKTRAE